MKKLIFKFWTHDSWYNFVADVEENEVSYKVKSTFSTEKKDGTLNKDSTKMFLDYLAKAEIEKWDGVYYVDKPMLDDGGEFNLCYVDDKTNVYFTIGMECCWPENFIYLASAMEICDKDINKFYDTSDHLGE